jgi:hypothetical protein
MVGELDGGNPHVQFDEGVQETCASVTRLCPTLPKPLASWYCPCYCCCSSASARCHSSAIRRMALPIPTKLLSLTVMFLESTYMPPDLLGIVGMVKAAV